MIDKEKILKDVKDWVREVGSIQVEKLCDKHKVDKKSTDIDLVTEVDKLSEQKLTALIEENYPNHSIIAEEEGEKKKDSDYTWIIDPLDGTTNYAQGFVLFSISVAVQYKGETIIGVVYAPALQQLYFAVRGKGAYLNETKLQISKVDQLEDAVLVTGFPYDRAISSNDNVDNFSNLLPKLRGVRRTGSAAFDLASTAAGVFDGFWELKLNSWDVAAFVS